MKSNSIASRHPFHFFTFFLAASLIIAGCSTGNKTERDRFFLLGNEALNNREYDEAIYLYTQSIEADPNYASAYNNRGVAKVEDGRPHEAILDYNRAIEIDSTYKDARFNRVYALEEAGRVDDAFEDLLKLETAYADSAFIYFYKGLLQTKLKDYDAGKESFHKAISLDTTNTESYVNLATLHYFQNSLDSAQFWLKYVLKRDPNEANAYNTLSQVFLAQGEYTLALGALNQALKIVPREPYFLNNRGYVYLFMDSLETALRDINKSILANPMNAWAYRNKGIYYLKKGDYQEAIRLFEDALNRNTFLDEIYSYLGEAYHQQGDKEKACEYWQKGKQQSEARSISLVRQYCQ
ncbi:MAG: tetratricopeptide repeat protein [Cyclobacteriaceae bacterium]